MQDLLGTPFEKFKKIDESLRSTAQVFEDEDRNFGHIWWRLRQREHRLLASQSRIMVPSPPLEPREEIERAQSQQYIGYQIECANKAMQKI
eukprot:3473984-Pyramimonas_sp.AAC.1